MGIDLLSLTPHQVSTDLSGYITFIYGAPKTGKTTLASQMPDALLLAFEKGYDAIPGIVAQDITSWSEFRQVYRELKKPEVKARFKTLIIDTVDYAADYCTKYICNQNNIEALGDLGYGKGWTKFKEEFDDLFHGLTQLGYAIIFISHDKEVTVTDPVSKTENLIVRPSLSNSPLAIIENMADIYGYAHQVRTDKGIDVRLTLRDNSGSIKCGSRFKYMRPEIPFTYEELSKALSDAIKEEANATNNKFVTDKRETAVVDGPKYDYEALMNEFNTLVQKLMGENQSNALKITTIVDKYLGKGKKVSDATPAQAEFIYLIVEDIKSDLM